MVRRGLARRPVLPSLNQLMPATVTDRVLIRVGHSPDPDDAFMFHALANDKIVELAIVVAAASAAVAKDCEAARA